LSRTLRLAFAGTPDFAVPALESLARSRHCVAVVYTQPDRPAGRGRKLSASSVNVAARRLGIAVEQPASLKDADARAVLAHHAVDLMIVAAYGLILPTDVLALPPLGCVNIHASLLPRWRGAAPIQRAILAGDDTTGISIMHMEAGLDTGPVFLRSATQIGPHENAGELELRLAGLGAQAMLEVLEELAAGRARAEPQESAAATYARKLEKREALIDWNAPAPAVERVVRAFNPWPVAETRWRGEQLRIWKARAIATAGAGTVAGDVHVQPGTVLACDEDLVVACSQGALAIEVLQLPGKRPAAAREFNNARDLRGVVLGGT